jgi:raffinose/stachyose/melibiose transport system permease protein
MTSRRLDRDVHDVRPGRPGDGMVICVNDIMRPRGWVIAAYMAPSVALFTFVVLVPIGMAGYLSLFGFSSIKRLSFVGLRNYLVLIRDPTVLVSLGNNLFLVAVCLVGQIGTAFVLASILSSPKVFAANLHRTVIYFPVTVSAIIIGYVWGFVYDYNYGLITLFQKLIGHAEWVQPLLAQQKTVMWCLSVPIIWQYVGFHLVIIMSGMSAIDKSIYEMAEIDGANGFQKAVRITLPMLRGTLAVCVLLCISANMRIFDHIVALTNGGPGYSSNVLALYAYNVSFSQLNMGYGNALSVATLVVTMALFLLARKALGLGGGKETA